MKWFLLQLTIFDSCKPVLCYGCASLSFTDGEFDKLTNAWNITYWKNFRVSDKSCIQVQYLNCLPFYDDVDAKQ